MPTLRVTGPLFNGRHRVHVRDFDADAVHWEQSSHRIGGDRDGRFTLIGEVRDLQAIFYDWLAYQVQVRDGRVLWVGYIQTMDFHHGGRIRRRSLDTVYNAIRGQYRHLLLNTGFETPGKGSETFARWQGAIDAGDSLIDETTQVAKGSHAAKLVSAGSGSNSHIYQETAVTPQTEYRLRFNGRGDGSHAPMYQVQDLTHGADLIPRTTTDNTSDTYRAHAVAFTTPAGCTLIRVSLYAAATAATVYFDDVTLVALDADGRPTDSFTAWVNNTRSIARYGRREQLVKAEDVYTAETDRDAALKQLAWPQITPSKRSQTQETKVDIYVVGYWATTFFRFLTIDSGGDTTSRSDLIRRIADTDCDWLDVGKLETDLGDYQLTTDGRTRAGTALTQMVQGHLYRLLVGNGRHLIYEAIPTTPRYRWQDGRYLGADGVTTVNPYAVRPGVYVRDMTYPTLRTDHEGVNENVTDYLVNAWQVKNGQLTEGD